MKSFSCKQNSIISTLAASILSTSYAQAGGRYLCIFENPGENTRFELDIREESSEAVLTYKYSPFYEPGVVQGKIQLNKTSATWSHFIFTGKDASATARASVPVGLADNSVHLDMDLNVNGKSFDAVNWLQCRPH